MNIKVLLYHVALTKISTLVPQSFLSLAQHNMYSFICIQSCQDEAAAVSHHPVDCAWFTGLTNSSTSVVTPAQGYSGDWWPNPHAHTRTHTHEHTHTHKHAQEHANTHADMFRQASLTTTQGQAHRSRQPQQVNCVGTRCDLKSSDWIRGKHCKWENWASVWSTKIKDKERHYRSMAR